MPSQAQTRHPNKWEELFPEEWFEQFDRAPIAYFSCSPLEWHGPHNALGCDGLKGYHVCLRAAEVSGGIVLPPMFLGPAGMPSLSRAGLREQRKWDIKAGLFYSRELTELVVEETFEHLDQLGFRVCMAFGGHWPNEVTMDDLVKRLDGRMGRMLLWAGAEIALGGNELAGEGKTAMDHGSMWESSVLMGAREDLVDTSRFGGTLGGRIPDPSWGISTETDPRDATMELGSRYVDLISRNLAAKASELLEQARKESADGV